MSYSQDHRRQLVNRRRFTQLKEGTSIKALYSKQSLKKTILRFVYFA